MQLDGFKSPPSQTSRQTRLSQICCCSIPIYSLSVLQTTQAAQQNPRIASKAIGLTWLQRELKRPPPACFQLYLGQNLSCRYGPLLQKLHHSTNKLGRRSCLSKVFATGSNEINEIKEIKLDTLVSCCYVAAVYSAAIPHQWLHHRSLCKSLFWWV